VLPPDPAAGVGFPDIPPIELVDPWPADPVLAEDVVPESPQPIAVDA
jgi:hypothetical protein